METRNKSNTEFRNEVSEALAQHASQFDLLKTQHESRFDLLNNNMTQVTTSLQNLQTAISELQTLSLRPSSNHQTIIQDVNSFTKGEASQKGRQPASACSFPSTGFDRSHQQFKLSFPKFSGNDPTGWVYKAEQFFEFQNIANDQRVQLASFHLEGLALQWHRWLTKYKGTLTWLEFTAAFLHRFGPTEYEDPSEALTRYRQVTTVAAYQEAFEGLSHRVDGLPEPFLVGCFIAGLRDDIRLDVKIKQPKTLGDTIGVARLVEERNLLQRKGNTFVRSTAISRPLPTTNSGVLGPPPVSKPVSTTAPSSFRRITNQEARERREKGLCFYYNEKFIPGHRCQRPQLFMIEDSTPEEMDTSDDCTVDIATVESFPEISFHDIAGTEHPQTIRVLGKLKNKDVTVLIDGGSTHNFIDQSIVSQFGLQEIRDKTFQVMVANREKIVCGGRCLALSILIQGHVVIADFYVLPVAACHVVLGVQWLATLGPIETDYRNLMMTFIGGGTKRMFQGIGRAGLEALSNKDLFNLQQTGLFLQITMTEHVDSITTYSSDLAAVLDKFAHVFDTPTTLPPNRSHNHRILLQPNSEPVSVRPYRYPYYQKTEIEKMVKELLESGLVRPSNSPFSSPVLLVKKADGTWRFCVDFRALNHITVKDKYPIPIVDELLDELHGARFFTKLDLRLGYHQIRVQESDIQKTAFRTHEGHYEFVVMPFGLTNAPATFQSLMNDLFRPYLRKYIIVFFDDILIYSKNWDEHISHIISVLTILSSNSLYVKKSKCQFGVSQVNYLGHVISEKGVEVDPSKIQAVVDLPEPTTVKGVRGFLGLAGYYRKLISGFGNMAAPLTHCLGKEGFRWGINESTAFNKLKQALTSPPVLRLPDFSQRFFIECDACGIGIGAILIQQGQPIAFFSEALKGSSLALSTYEKEMLAIVKAIRKWRPYLLGRPFTVRTDHKSLKFLLEQRITTPAQTRWLPKLLGYDYVVEYKKGPDNKGADALSRKVEFNFLAVSLPRPYWWIRLQQEVQQDSFYTDLFKLNSGHQRQLYTCKDGVWFKGGKVYLNPSSTLIPSVLADHHSSPVGGHFGYHKTLAKIRGLLQPLSIPTKIWTEVSMDFVEGLPPSLGNTVIMVVVDRLSKYAHFVALKHPFTAIIVAKSFIANVVKLHGIPVSIVSDRDKVVNRTLEQYLRCFTGDQPHKWVDWLPWAEFSYNTVIHSSTKISPFEAVYGISPPNVLSYVPGTTRVQAVDEYLHDRDSVLQDLRHQLVLARDRMKTQADKHRREVHFTVGDFVYLKLQPYRQTSVAFCRSMKLAPRYFGPYQVLAKVGEVAYKLALPAGSQIHNVFHVSRLRKCLSSVVPVSPELPPVSATSTILP
ncbi:PREDICTED: transposon Ty3-G Gag-Pol polyprotein [Populus euphratica]|uniref:Transposon Ty3-G Gag-Pol polyprotein n=1 Tax=Populus euphratica TaxID=75702 RepID=A0AAJ6XQK4_POPEU|nr:PREDICTED: transposon Ty3-G Gag-Pol polyprotein [Populus euphratica]